MTIGQDLLDGPPPTLLPVDNRTTDALGVGATPEKVAADFPDSSLAWAILADQAWGEKRVIESYAFARVGYHRGLDSLRKNGWKGFGPVPWSHEPNQGFLRCLNALARSAKVIGETAEATRCAQFLTDCDPAATQALAE
ncbi:unannotated protein [freshwater metagenome]|uniref:Unannotated protein n=1 Tax=freshwater metagenome TaxID=449393 RepID=A0A6J5ZST0_9ZZZZ|nr:DUF3151 family protein [Actinomycetota bacterium]MSW24224.1 DUF3151 family protein [Actinomycetota bacterium]MSX30124.1 DUF3151 family protein [Actinomycetota bacterium]MSX42712.1 DUF3151 family protein [Actinomycetota bacterium]MSX97664.1 DUF3151 family protein [Actinomycetota bacterium]